MRKGIVFTMLFMTAALYNPNAYSALGGSVYGLVTDEYLKIPLNKVELLLDIGYTKLKFFTLPNGYYSSFAPEGRNYTLTAKKQGYKTKTVTGIEIKPNSYVEKNIKLTPDRILSLALKGHQGKYVCADLGKGGILVCDRASVGQWEKFKFVRVSGTQNTYGIIASNGKFVCADADKGGRLVADRMEFGDWEHFKLETLSEPGTVALVSLKGKYVQVRADGSLYATGDRLAAESRFRRFTY